jgi:hypothetical protein
MFLWNIFPVTRQYIFFLSNCIFVFIKYYLFTWNSWSWNTKQYCTSWLEYALIEHLYLWFGSSCYFWSLLSQYFGFTRSPVLNCFRSLMLFYNLLDIVPLIGSAVYNKQYCDFRCACQCFKLKMRCNYSNLKPWKTINGYWWIIYESKISSGLLIMELSLLKVFALKMPSAIPPAQVVHT